MAEELKTQITFKQTPPQKKELQRRINYITNSANTKPQKKKGLTRAPWFYFTQTFNHNSSNKTRHAVFVGSVTSYTCSFGHMRSGLSHTHTHTHAQHTLRLLVWLSMAAVYLGSLAVEYFSISAGYLVPATQDSPNPIHPNKTVNGLPAACNMTMGRTQMNKHKQFFLSHQLRRIMIVKILCNSLSLVFFATIQRSTSICRR